MTRRAQLLAGLFVLGALPLLASCGNGSGASNGAKESDGGSLPPSGDDGSQPTAPSDASGTPVGDDAAPVDDAGAGSSEGGYVPGEPLPDDGGGARGLLGHEQHPGGQERDDVQVPEPHQRQVPGRRGLLELQERHDLRDALHRRAADLRHARQRVGPHVLLPLRGGDATCASDPTKSKYYDFIEHTIGATQYNGNTTRVDAFGLKIAMRLHCADGFDVAVGEDYATFAEDRAVTFQKFIDEVPAEFQALAQAPYAPYRIVEPGAGGFKTGGAYATLLRLVRRRALGRQRHHHRQAGPERQRARHLSRPLGGHLSPRRRPARAPSPPTASCMNKTLWSDPRRSTQRRPPTTTRASGTARAQRQGVRLSLRRRRRLLELHLARQSAVHAGRDRLVRMARDAWRLRAIQFFNAQLPDASAGHLGI